MEPRYQHTCPFCHFVSTFTTNDEVGLFTGLAVDVYLHDTESNFKTLFIKHGDDEAEYTSYPIIETILTQVTNKSATLNEIVLYLRHENLI